MTNSHTFIPPMFGNAFGDDFGDDIDLDFGLLSEYLFDGETFNSTRPSPYTAATLASSGPAFSNSAPPISMNSSAKPTSVAKNVKHAIAVKKNMPKAKSPKTSTASNASTSASTSSQGQASDDEGDGSSDDDNDLNLGARESVGGHRVDRRRERNRVLARKTRLRKKFFFESLQRQVAQLTKENDMLKNIVKQRLKPDIHQKILSECCAELPLCVTASSQSANSLLDVADYRLMAAIQTAQRSFCITDPSLPDNPIVFASNGFLELTGYTLDQIVGRNCRFLQGPGTDPVQVDILRKGVTEGTDTSVCLLNYKADGTEFYNQVFIAALKDENHRIVNYVGVQVEVNKRPTALKDESESDGESKAVKGPKKSKLPRAKEVTDKKGKGISLSKSSPSLLHFANGKAVEPPGGVSSKSFLNKSISSASLIQASSSSAPAKSKKLPKHKLDDPSSVRDAKLQLPPNQPSLYSSENVVSNNNMSGGLALSNSGIDTYMPYPFPQSSYASTEIRSSAESSLSSILDPAYGNNNSLFSDDRSEDKRSESCLSADLLNGVDVFGFDGQDEYNYNSNWRA